MIVNLQNNTFKRNVIAIDGLSGSGKTSLGKRLAEHLHMGFLSSGLLFRIIAYKYIYGCIKHENNILISESDFHINNLQSDKISKKSSELAKNSKIRNFVKNYQREYVGDYQGNWVIVEGRDCGTVVFPESEIKIFLTANHESRAKRRCLELSSNSSSKDSQGSNMNTVADNLLKRDNEDLSRNIDPVKPAEDAYIVDNTDMTFEETCEHVIKYILSHESYQK